MPGIDGWTTLHRLREQGLSAAPVAIVSANAFDKGLDNDIGLPPQDFLVKPVRRDELLHWLGQRLGLTWQAADVAAQATAAPASTWPPATQLAHGLDATELGTLRELARLGYYRGFVQQIDRLSELHTDCAQPLQRLRALAREFRFESIEQILQEALDEAEHLGG